MYFRVIFVTKSMTEGKPLKLILQFAVPLLLGNLLQQMYNLVDAAIVVCWHRRTRRRRRYKQRAVSGTRFLHRHLHRLRYPHRQKLRRSVLIKCVRTFSTPCCLPPYSRCSSRRYVHCAARSFYKCSPCRRMFLTTPTRISSSFSSASPLPYYTICSPASCAPSVTAARRSCSSPSRPS